MAAVDVKMAGADEDPKSKKVLPPVPLDFSVVFIIIIRKSQYDP